MIGFGPLASRPLASVSGTIIAQTTVNVSYSQTTFLFKQPLRNIAINLYYTYLINKIPNRTFVFISSANNLIAKQTTKIIFNLSNSVSLLGKNVTKNSTVTNNQATTIVKTNNKAVILVNTAIATLNRIVARARTFVFTSTSLTSKTNNVSKNTQLVQSSSGSTVLKTNSKTITQVQISSPIMSKITLGKRSIVYTVNQTIQQIKAINKTISGNILVSSTLLRATNYYRSSVNSVGSVIQLIKANNKTIAITNYLIALVLQQTTRSRTLVIGLTNIVIKNVVTNKPLTFVQTTLQVFVKSSTKNIVILSSNIVSALRNSVFVRTLNYYQSQNSLVIKLVAKTIAKGTSTSLAIVNKSNYYRNIVNNIVNISTINKVTLRTITTIGQSYTTFMYANAYNRVVNIAEYVVSSLTRVTQKNVYSQQQSVTTISKSAVKYLVVLQQGLKLIVKQFAKKVIVAEQTTTNLIKINQKQITTFVSTIASKLNQIYHNVPTAQPIYTTTTKTGSKNVVTQQQSLVAVQQKFYIIRAINSLISSSVFVRNSALKIITYSQSYQLYRQLIGSKTLQQNQQTKVTVNRTNTLTKLITQSTINVVNTISSIYRTIVSYANSNSSISAKQYIIHSINIAQSNISRLITQSSFSIQLIALQFGQVTSTLTRQIIRNIITSVDSLSTRLNNTKTYITNVVDSVADNQTIAQYYRILLAKQQTNINNNIVGRYYTHTVGIAQTTISTVTEQVKLFVTECCRIIGINLVDNSVDVSLINQTVIVDNQQNVVTIPQEISVVAVPAQLNTIIINEQTNTIEVAACNCTETK